LIYAAQDGCPVIGANIYLFLKSVFDVAGTATNKNLAVAKTTTRANGRWTESVNIDPGTYTLLYEKPGEYGPNTRTITVTSVAPMTQSPAQSSAEQPKPVSRIKKINKNPDNDFWAI